MTTLRVQHAFQGASGLPEDQYVNTFYFVGTTLDAGDLQALNGAVTAFYDTLGATQNKQIQSYMGSLSDTAGRSVKIYDMADAMPRPRKFEEVTTPAAHGTGGGNNLPNELAVCLSYKASFPTSVPVARRRGRVYIGPLASIVMDSSTTADAMVVNGFCDDLVKAAKHMAALSNTAGWQWAVYSPTDAAAYTIDTVWCDNAFDIQRRRGTPATTRITASVP